VSDLLAATGATVRAGDPVVVLQDSSVARATAWVEESAANRVRVGDRATLVPADGHGVPLTGKVRALGAGIVEVPQRFWQIPGEPMFGRAVFIDLDPPPTSAPAAARGVPGQRYETRFGARG
jgi:hypothetical protein